MLQNRIDPFGNIISTPDRGDWMGNRGVIHNEQKKIVRPYKLKAWITCVLKFKNRYRQVMSLNRYTELFFLDESTAFSAGHRPCAECRRDAFNRFKRFWVEGNSDSGFNLKTPIAEIDAIIHKERIGAKNEKKTHWASFDSLPDGTFIKHEGRPYLKRNGQIQEWSTAGYGKPTSYTGEEQVEVLTPSSIVNTFKAGYVPQMNS